MTFARTLSAEALKMKRTIALKMVVIAPIAVVLFTLFITSQAPFTSLNRATAPDPWKVLARINLQFWGLLMLPLYVTLQTALIAGIDHAENQWKALFARPVPRWTAYIAKLLVVMAMIAVSAVILVLGIWGEGRLLDWFDGELGFAKTAPLALIGGQAAQMTGLAFLFLTIQHWVSLRWRSFSIAVGFGAVATVANIATLLAAGPYGGWPQYFPWSLPTLVIARAPQNIDLALWLGGLAGLGTMILGCADFCRREIQ
jgi:hypothetical protein